jgi:Flp pilus assembly protein TadB
MFLFFSSIINVILFLCACVRAIITVITAEQKQQQQRELEEKQQQQQQRELEEKQQQQRELEEKQQQQQQHELEEKQKQQQAVQQVSYFKYISSTYYKVSFAFFLSLQPNCFVFSNVPLLLFRTSHFAVMAKNLSI